MLTFEQKVDLELLANHVEHLGELADFLRVLKANGWTREAARYTIDQVW